MCGLYFKRDEQDMDILNRMAYEYHDDEEEHDANRRCRNNKRAKVCRWKRRAAEEMGM